ncbi:ABC transporter ATP-binding protein [Thermoflexus sp.]|uniref:ABC transporter ATP-binding protein n=1 Tax=Thermoflexus sp. TaxID=1969742 RepID=UPI0025ECB1F7|nr:ABC transporter ATP-binding protein [Thermoflexus sp.]MDW8180187.1 ABC transporter ATP-binding protein [Anaerolineae bacterium]MCS6964249.1 ABC transporter ATP-binding protein [Thermoflexus sp.]MCS7350736.1 ABC transporter ATP-binding protein [Thermoflexus sp.]MCX7691401.1 ABC transporter ATP-binding protein [Thermoflexus sp.]MDW8185680.1 ABC transporter ATP-binding protein [Anaerolineae bacterium]
MTGEVWAVRTERLTRVYRVTRKRGQPPQDRIALQEVDLEIYPGELFGLLGPNGAGKTTLIKILTTLLLPTSGRAWVAGYDVVTQPESIRRRINMVAGGESCGYGLLTVRENLWMFSQFYGLDNRTARRRIEELLERFELRDRGDSKMSDLSTGLRQKVNVIRGFLTDPEILFLDEPTLGLDVNAARQIRSFVRSWIQERPGRTILLTTHYMLEAEELCDRVAIIDRGRILACDAPQELKRRLQRDAIFSLEVTKFPQHIKLLSGIPGVRQVHHRHHNGHLELDLILEEEGVIGPVISALTAKGVHILSLRKREPTLEDVFVSLVGRGLSEAGEEESA